MKKIITLLILVFLFSNAMVFAVDTKDELYYKRQIQNQRYL